MVNKDVYSIVLDTLFLPPVTGSDDEGYVSKSVDFFGQPD